MRMPRIVLLGLAAAAFASAPINVATPQSAPGPEPPRGTLVLDEKENWRKHYSFLRPVFDGDAKPNPPAFTPPLADGVWGLFAAAPPADWTKPEFDDSEWLLRRGQEFSNGIRDPKLEQQIGLDATSIYLRGSDPFFAPVGLVCQRTRFLVRDRAQVRKLALSLTYRGGFIAYLNGREVARGHLPEGPIEPHTAAAVYPPEAFFYKDSLGKGRPRPLDPKDGRSDQWTLRERAFGPADIPLDALRNGVNVLALELHRSVYPKECARDGIPCATAGLGLLELRADADADVFAPGAAGPGLRAAAVEVTRTVYDPARSGLNESAGPVRIAAARNGTFSGQVAVSAAGGRAVEDLSVALSPLRAEGGAVLPAACVRVRYGNANPLWPTALNDLGMAAIPLQWKRDAGLAGGTRFDVLADAPPPAAPAVAVWLSVTPPKDAAPGRYAGELMLTAKSAEPVSQAIPGREPERVRVTVKVPVRIDVADWTLPDVKDYATLMNIYQSPETLAEYYRVKPWSDAHWRLIEKSMQLMAEMGNIGIFIPLLAESQMGNPESMVVWVKQPDGTYAYDFTAFDRYIDAALKYHDRGRLQFISLNVWGYEASLRTWRGPRDYAAFYGARVTVQDGATGARRSEKLPQYGTDECEKVWRPALLAVQARLKARGLEQKILLGLTADQGPDPAATAMFHNILPDAGWISESHNLNNGYVYDSKTKAFMPVRYNSIVYGADIPDPASRRLYGWQRRLGVLVMNFNRSGSCLLLMGYPPPWSFRMWMESTLACGRNGNGRVGGDYWHVGTKILGDGERGWGVVGGSGGTFFGRYMHSHADEAGLGRNCTDLFGPGPDGPVTTVRLENAREGNEESEARAFIEKALLDAGRRLPADLVKRCRDLLDERTNVVRLWRIGAAHIAPQGWQERSRRLFDAAGEVARNLR